jgi:hypothetical protein
MQRSQHLAAPGSQYLKAISLFDLRGEVFRMKPDDQQSIEPSLTPIDQDAVDQLMEKGLGSNEPSNEQEQKVHDLLAMLATPVEDESLRQTRIDLIEVLARRAQQDTPRELTLGSADQQACDAFVEAGYSAQQVDVVHQPRAEKLEQLGSLLTAGTAANSNREQLVESTLAGIQAHIDAEESSMRLEPRGGFQLPGRWADLVSVAAMLLLAASVILPIMSGMRSMNQRTICMDNMGSTANAFGLYVGENRDMLPMATAGFGTTWMDVGTTPDRSNSSNLYTLIRNQFVGLDDLACPTNPNAATGDADPNAWDWNSIEELSYSYRIMPRGGMRATTTESPVRVVLLADRSPVILRVKAMQAIRPEENSPNHEQTGQHMLMLDGSSHWSQTPVLEARDNIWLPRPIESVIHLAREKHGIITGNEVPAGPTDAFVGP